MVSSPPTRSSSSSRLNESVGNSVVSSTVTETDAEISPQATVICVLPNPCGTMLPSLSTVATNSSEELHTGVSLHCTKDGVSVRLSYIDIV